VWNESGAVLGLNVLPQFWQTWWFRLLLGAAVILLVVGAYEIRLARIRALARLRLRIGRDLHDEVGSNLGSIALVAQMMQGDPTASAADAGEIRRIVSATVESLRDIVWFLEPAYDLMSDLVAKMKDAAETMLRGVPFEFREEGELGPVKLSLAFRRNALPIFKEVLNNIIKHSKASRVEVTVSGGPRLFRLSVRDNGAGFDPQQVRPGNGMKNLQRRAAEMGGKLQFLSEPGRGTTVIVEAPLGRRITWMRE
jgi:signal transduction histidine kinase